MENEFFLNAGIPPAGPLRFGASSATQSHNWQSLSSAIEIQDTELNCSAEPVPDYFLNPNWKKSTNQGGLLESALSSMVSSPAASNSNNLSNDSFVIWELIGSNSVEISPHSQPLLAYMGGAGGDSANTSCYGAPLNTPPNLNLLIESIPSLMVSNSTVADCTADPGFAERAANLCCFGNRSFNSRTTQVGQTNTELASSSIPNKLSPVSSGPSLNAVRSQLGNKNSSPHDLIESRNSSSPEASTVSEQAPPIGESGFEAASDSNSTKRKAVPKGKAKEPSQSPSNNASKVTDANTESNLKRIKTNEGNGRAEAEEDETKGSNLNGGDNKQTKTNNSNTKPPGTPKDYIHVRARRGQATDSHSLAERVRREKISERMKFLQDLVPGCSSKVIGKALMLDEIINYVQSLQGQVELLSMKLASVNTRLDVNMDKLLSKDFPRFSEYDLQTIAQMGFGQNPDQEPTLLSQSFLPWFIPSIQHEN